MDATITPASRWRRWLLPAAALVFVAAVLVAVHDVTGLLWQREVPLKKAGFREQSGAAYRYSLSNKNRWAPERYEPLTRLYENGAQLSQVGTKENVVSGPPGQFAWTQKNLWISPRDTADPRTRGGVFLVQLPVVIPLWLRLVLYLAAGLGVAAVLMVRQSRNSLVSGCKRAWAPLAPVWVRMRDRLLRWTGSEETQAMPASSQRGAFASITVTVLGSVFLLLCSDAGRPVWMDEFLHFVLASYDSAAEAGHVVYTTTVGINHGQTGVYMMLDHWLLKWFGASAVILRLPSLASTVLLLGGAVSIMRSRGLGLLWQWLVLAALAGQQACVMHYVPEARPYIPLAGASVGVLAYYLTSENRRRGLAATLLGWTSILWGVMIHPYFAVYWLALFLFAHGVKLSEGASRTGWRSLFRHVNLPASLVGSVVFIIVGKLTWLRGGPSFPFDPFQWIKREHLFSAAVDGCHFEFLAYHPLRLALMAACAVTPVIFILLPVRLRQTWQPLVAPALLVCLAMGISALLAWLSYRRDYWILTRQWVASAALVPIGVVWFWGVLSRTLVPRLPSLAALLVIGFVAVTTMYAVRMTHHRLAGAAAVRAAPPAAAPLPAAAYATPPTTPEDWVALANDNIARGGPVWPVFQHYYGRIIWIGGRPQFENGPGGNTAPASK